MKRTLAILLALIVCHSLMARHIKGGEITYRYVGPGVNGTDRYEILLRLFLDCNASGSQLDDAVNIAIYSTGGQTAAPGSPFTLPLTDDQFINLSFPNPCIINPSPVCYRLRTYGKVIDLPRTESGFTAVFQRCCRIDGINNLSPNVSIGSSYVTQIHGTSSLPNGGTNSSPFFVVKDTVLICQNRPFRLDFGAVDPNKEDSLSYEFCDAFNCPSNPPVITNPPPVSGISFVTYAGGFSGVRPLGPNVTINPRTGLISGIAPPGGNYVVSVCVSEWRAGRRLSTHRKDFNVQIDDRCDFASAQLAPTYTNCDNYTLAFRNEAPPSPLVNSYFWDFGVGNRSDDTSNSAAPTFTFPDTGVYTVKLIVNKGQSCPDSSITQVRIFPGFYAGFTVEGACKDFPFKFTDTTKTRYGFVSTWKWDFGDEVGADNSIEQNPSWKYSGAGTKPVRFIVESSKGCIDTVQKDIIVYDKPPIMLPFSDTLICSIDTLQLGAAGLGLFSWAPNYNILNANTPNPLVYPKFTTDYEVTLNDRGCINKDTIRVRVVDFVTLNAAPDSTICLTDGVELHAVGDGLKFRWTPAGTLDDPTKKRPIATPTGNTTYTVVASIGKCDATDNVTIRTIPYPQAFAGPDTTICYDDTARLHGRMVGYTFNWAPGTSLLNANTLNPLAFPLRSSNYILSVYDTLGCPKPFRDTMRVHVLDQIFAFAGNDTAIVVGQPLQLRGRGADFFDWSPPLGLNRSNVGTPIATLSNNQTYYLRASNEQGCFDIDTINIRVFKTLPDIFVPNAFTPGGTYNNLFRPAATPGISKLDFFRVYNRWGQLVFSTNEIGRGWDGTVAGTRQNSGSYVWIVQGKDYTGRTVAKKGTMVLIR